MIVPEKQKNVFIAYEEARSTRKRELMVVANHGETISRQ